MDASEAIHTFFEGRHTTGLGPGVSVALIDRGKPPEVLSFGASDVVAATLVTPATRFAIGSVSKSITAAAFLRLRDEGSVDLHSPVTNHLDWFDVPSAYEPMTLHHLLTHTAGLVALNDTVPGSEFAVWGLRNTELGFAPGDRFHYSNMGYLTLGYVLAAITNMSFSESLKHLVFKPLGMHSSLGAIPVQRPPDTSRGHYAIDTSWNPVMWSGLSGGHAGVMATAPDLMRFLQMLLCRGDTFLPAGSVRQMTHGDVATDWPGYTYGYGLYGGRIEHLGGHHIIQHGGENPGFETVMLGDLDMGIGVVVMVNSYRPPWQEAEHALRILQADAAGRSLPEPPPHRLEAAEPPQPARPDSQLLAGHYRAHASMMTDIAIRANGADLVLEWDDGYQQSLTHLGASTYTVGERPTPERIRFGPFVGNKALALDFSGGIYARIDPEQF